MNLKLFATKMFIASLAVFAPIRGMIIAVLVLILVDLITGVWAAYKRKEAIKSAWMRRTVSKLLVYEIAIMMSFITQTYLCGDLIPMASIAAGLIGMTELKSILENLSSISGEDLIKQIIDKLGSSNQP